MPKAQDRKTQRLYVTAYSCNASAHREIEQLFKGKPFYLYEYFALAPYAIDEGSSGPWIAPFLAKVAARQQVIPEHVSVKKAAKTFAIEKVNYVPKTVDQVEKYVRDPAKIMNVYKSTRIGAFVLANAGDLKAAKATGGRFPDGVVRGSISVSTDKQSPVCRMIAGAIPFRELREGKYLWAMKLSEADKLGNFLEYLVAVHPWVSAIPKKVADDPKQQLYYISVPIASDGICFGYLLFFHWDEKVHAAVTALLSDSPLPLKSAFDDRLCAQRLLQTIARYARTVYMPVLALFENQWHEDIFSKQAKWSTRLWDSVCFLRAKDGRGEKDAIVKSLTKLWKRRRECWNVAARSMRPTALQHVRKRICETLIFPKFTVASPQMVGVIEKILRSKTQTTGNNSILTALIVGGPGTGKDALAKMIPLFCDSYWFAPIVAVNMAQLRPNQLVPLLTMGFNKKIAVGAGRRSLEIDVEGLIQEFARKVNDAFDGCPSKFRGLGNPEQTIRGVLVLDELNSMDIDAQGALLRLLENTDLSGIGEISIDGEKRRKTGPLFIVGIINETPRLLTREETLRSLLAPGGLLAGPIGEAIYELFRKMRRLRDDLYYRIRRGCEVEIPALAMRREDIPILFFDQLDKIHPAIVIPPSTFDTFLRPDISWPGNIRQLQSLCNRVAGYLEETRELVYPEDVERAMREEKLIIEQSEDHRRATTI